MEQVPGAIPGAHFPIPHARTASSPHSGGCGGHSAGSGSGSVREARPAQWTEPSIISRDNGVFSHGFFSTHRIVCCSGSPASVDEREAARKCRADRNGQGGRNGGGKIN